MNLFNEQEEQRQGEGECAQSGAPGSSLQSLPSVGDLRCDPFRNPGTPQYRAKDYPHGSTVTAHSGPNAGRSGTVIAHKNSHTLTIRWDLSSTTEQP